MKDVAQIGAVIGREFSYGLIAAVAALPEKDLKAALAQLVAAELIFQRGVPPDATYNSSTHSCRMLPTGVWCGAVASNCMATLHGMLEERFPMSWRPSRRRWRITSRRQGISKPP